MPHALAIGASGMLAGACHGLAERGWTVTVMARDPERLRAATAGDPRLVPVSADYSRPDFSLALANAALARGWPTLAVCWMHSSGFVSLVSVATALAPAGRLLHVLGSGRVDPSGLGDPQLAAEPALRYQRVVLGYQVDDGRSRWLTDVEISTGVLAAVDDPTADPYVVGQVEPWSDRP